eukprot:3939090-Rhodomonas_salina.1
MASIPRWSSAIFSATVPSISVFALKTRPNAPEPRMQEKFEPGSGRTSRTDAALQMSVSAEVQALSTVEPIKSTTASAEPKSVQRPCMQFVAWPSTACTR